MAYLVRLAIIVSATALFAGCGGSQAPIGVPGAMPQSRAIATHPERGGSWTLPDAKSEDLLYVSDQQRAVVYVLTYPAGKPVGKLTGFYDPVGECVDKGGDVFIVNESDGGGSILEYAHGGSSPIATLSDDYSPLGCAVDQKTGNLAVSNGEPGGVSIYANAQGIPTVYTDSNLGAAEFCGYDDRGNLFVDGHSGLQFTLAELPSGRSTFTKITIDKSLQAPGAVQWDGKDLVIGDAANNAVYFVQVSGSVGTVVGTTQLTGIEHKHLRGQFWIQRTMIVAPFGTSAYTNSVGVWSFPAGSPIALLNRRRPNQLFGVTVSLAPSR
jgi:hypothetical protein